MTTRNPDGMIGMRPIHRRERAVGTRMIQVPCRSTGEVVISTPEELTALTRAERVKWAEVVKAAGVKIE
jgi:hypothetical protein